jgi:ABC-type multidrug transport system ATPase subunit
MKRKLSFAISIVADPTLLILDEPTSAMDTESRTSVWEIIKNQAKMRSIILTTQHMDEADYLGDRIALMVHGKIKCIGSVEYVKKTFGTG